MSTEVLLLPRHPSLDIMTGKLLSCRPFRDLRDGEDIALVHVIHPFPFGRSSRVEAAFG